MKMKVGAATLLMSLMTADQAFAGFWNVVPTPTPVPEFDGSSGIAVVALLAGLAAVVFNRAKSK
jgi:hypothetical protein